MTPVLRRFVAAGSDEPSSSLHAMSAYRVHVAIPKVVIPKVIISESRVGVRVRVEVGVTVRLGVRVRVGVGVKVRVRVRFRVGVRVS